MTGDRQRDYRDASSTAWAILGTLMSGIAVWGGIGWLIDRWLGFSALFLPIGVIVGVAASIYLVVIRYTGRP